MPQIVQLLRKALLHKNGAFGGPVDFAESSRGFGVAHEGAVHAPLPSPHAQLPSPRHLAGDAMVPRVWARIEHEELEDAGHGLLEGSVSRMQPLEPLKARHTAGSTPPLHGKAEKYRQVWRSWARWITVRGIYAASSGGIAWHADRDVHPLQL